MSSEIFEDRLGGKWDLTLTYGDVIAVKKEIGLDLLDAQATFEAMARDFAVFLNVVYIVCRRRKPDLKEADFPDLFDGEAHDRAQKAFEVAYVNFSRAEVKPHLRRVIEARDKVQAKEVAKATAKVETMDLEGLMQAEFDKLTST
jgi:hypothetical protein